MATKEAVLKNYEVTFKGDSWRLIVEVQHTEGDLAGLIEKAITTAKGGEIGINLEGYYEVSEVEI